MRLSLLRITVDPESVPGRLDMRQVNKIMYGTQYLPRVIDFLSVINCSHCHRWILNTELFFFSFLPFMPFSTTNGNIQIMCSLCILHICSNSCHTLGPGQVKSFELIINCVHFESSSSRNSYQKSQAQTVTWSLRISTCSQSGVWNIIFSAGPESVSEFQQKMPRLKSTTPRICINCA